MLDAKNRSEHLLFNYDILWKDRFLIDLQYFGATTAVFA